MLPRLVLGRILFPIFLDKSIAPKYSFLGKEHNTNIIDISKNISARFVLHTSEVHISAFVPIDSHTQVLI